MSKTWAPSKTSGQQPHLTVDALAVRRDERIMVHPTRLHWQPPDPCRMIATLTAKVSRAACLLGKEIAWSRSSGVLHSHTVNAPGPLDPQLEPGPPHAGKAIFKVDSQVYSHRMQGSQKPVPRAQTVNLHRGGTDTHHPFLKFDRLC